MSEETNASVPAAVGGGAGGTAGAASFRASYRGRFVGLLSWDDVARAFDAVACSADEGWWVYDTREAVPVATVPAAALGRHLEEIRQFLHRHHKADYCGFVYADDKMAPRLLKVFDPRNASSCSLGSPVPVYTISRAMPEALPLKDTETAGGAAEKPAAGLLRRVLKGRS